MHKSRAVFDVHTSNNSVLSSEVDWHIVVVLALVGFNIPLPFDILQVISEISDIERITQELIHKVELFSQPIQSSVG